jgi:hypothetical protein
MFSIRKLKKGKGKDQIHTALVMDNFLLVLAA